MQPSTRSDAQHHVKLIPSRLKLDLEPITYDRYWRFALLPSRLNYQFCSNMGTAPIQNSEFTHAKNSFPIVFFETAGQIAPHIVLGLAPHVNLALTHNDEWRRGLYVPALFESYPFGVIDAAISKEKKSFERSLSFETTNMGVKKNAQLGIVPNNPMLIPTKENNPLAHELYQQDGSITSYLTQVLNKTVALRDQQADTSSFTSALKANGLLAERSIRLHFRDGRKITLDGFSTISNSAYNGISPSTKKRWEELGYTALIEHHLTSLDKWTHLIALHERRLNRALRNLRSGEGDSTFYGTSN